MPNRLEELRVKRGLSRPTVAALCDTSETQIYRLERGLRKLYDTDWLYNLAQVLKCYPSELLPLEWQSPPQAIHSGLLQKAIIKASELKEAVKETDNELSEEQFAILVSIVYEKLLQGNSTETADILQLFKKPD